MSKRTPDWDDQRAFLAVLREGSLSGAARTLGVAQATVRRRIETLERNMNTRLFTRSAASLLPTPGGLSLKPHLEAMEIAAEALVRTAANDASSCAGRVRIASSEMIGVEILSPILMSLRARLPDLCLELSLHTKVESLSRQEADIAVRSVRPMESTVVARRIGKISVGLYASESYLAQHGEPNTMEELAMHAFVGPDRDSKDIDKLRLHGIEVDRMNMAVRTDLHLAQLAAVRAGVGIGACHRSIAARSGLRAVLVSAFGFQNDLWLAMAQDLRKVRRVRLTFDTLAEQLARELAE